MHSSRLSYWRRPRSDRWWSELLFPADRNKVMLNVIAKLEWYSQCAAPRWELVRRPAFGGLWSMHGGREDLQSGIGLLGGQSGSQRWPKKEGGGGGLNTRHSRIAEHQMTWREVNQSKRQWRLFDGRDIHLARVDNKGLRIMLSRVLCVCCSEHLCILRFRNILFRQAKSAEASIWSLIFYLRCLLFPPACDTSVEKGKNKWKSEKERNLQQYIHHVTCKCNKPKSPLDPQSSRPSLSLPYFCHRFHN